jgi:hypothetical protein
MSDKVFTIKALSLSSVFKLCENLVKQQYIDDAKQISESLPPQERGKFMLDVWQKIPRNNDILEIAQEKLATLEGVMTILKYVIKKNNDISEAALEDLLQQNINLSNIQYYTDLVMKVIGLKNDDVLEEDEIYEDGKKN